MNKRIIQALIAVSAALAGYVITDRIPFLSMGERWLADYRIATLLPPEPQHPDIVIAAITEDTLRQFPYRTPVDRRFLAGLIETLEKDGVRAIGLDVLFDQPTEPDKDERLKAVIDAVRVPLAISTAGAEEGLNDAQLAFQDAFVPPAAKGMANLAKDGFDGTVRQTFPGKGGKPSLAYALAVQLTGHEGPPGPVSIAWHGQPSADVPAFRELPAQAVPMLPAAWLRNKIVLIGADLTLTDRHRTPFSTVIKGPRSLMPGITVHAHTLAQLIDHRAGPAAGPLTGGALALGAAVIGVALAELASGLAMELGLAALALIALWGVGFWAFPGLGILLPLVTPTLALAGAVWAADVHGNRQDRKMKKFILDAFSRYVAPSIVDHLVADPKALKLGGERREISILFTDLAGFTTLSEKADPDTLGPMLNGYLGGISRIVIDHQGTIVDFIGDAVMAIFGAPVIQPDHAARAVACARAIDAYSTQFRSTGEPARWDWGITRIGVHAGTVLIGNFGAEIRFKYSPVGDAVNSASRLEGLNKHFGTRLIASEAVLPPDQRTAARPIGRIILKGRKDAMEVFELLEPGLADTPFFQRYRLAYDALDRGDVRVATAKFTELSFENPNDGCVALHLGRLAAGACDTEIRMTEK